MPFLNIQNEITRQVLFALGSRNRARSVHGLANDLNIDFRDVAGAIDELIGFNLVTIYGRTRRSRRPLYLFNRYAVVVNLNADTIPQTFIDSLNPPNNVRPDSPAVDDQCDCGACDCSESGGVLQLVDTYSQEISDEEK